jgi:hypothetical protein
MQGRLKWLVIALIVIAGLALTGWLIPEFGTMLMAAGSVAVLLLIGLAWLSG